MKIPKKTMSKELTRRETLKLSGLALGGLAMAGIGGPRAANAQEQAAPPSGNAGQTADPFYPGEALTAEEMRITFCGTWFTPRMIQAANSIFVELGNGDSFVFDCGSGVVTKYVALGVAFSRMDKVFLTHLHADHTSDLFFIYCFGPSSDRKSALKVWGPSGDTSDEGTSTFCQKMCEMAKWHRESFSFLPTGYLNSGDDGYNLVATELPYMDNPGTAYDEHGVTITHFPAIHTRDGAISYKLEWNGLSMVFTGDTKPNDYVLQHAQGVDILIHEMTTPPDVWTTKETGLVPGDAGYDEALALNQEVQDSSHTLQTAFGYILSQTRPRLGVATHFPIDPDLIEPAFRDIRSFYSGPVTIARDLLVINVSKEEIRQRMAVVPDYPWFSAEPLKGPLAPSKYTGALAQFNAELLTHVIPAASYTKWKVYLPFVSR
jgi:ribonuclease Z